MPGLNVGAISGVVSEEGLIKEGSPVLLLDRAKQKVVSRQLTDSSGGFVFSGLELDKPYILLATDEDGETPKNAIVRDRVLASPNLSGDNSAANWWYLVNSKLVCMAFIPATTPGDRLASATPAIFPPFVISSGSSDVTVTLDPSITPGAPQFGALMLDDSWLLVSGYRNVRAMNETSSVQRWINSSSRTAFSLEAVFDPSTGSQRPVQWSVVQWGVGSGTNESSFSQGINTSTSSYYRSGNGIIRAEYDPPTQTFTLSCATPSGGAGTSYLNRLTTLGTYVLLDDDILGPVHFVVTVSYNEEWVLYINGEARQSGPLSAGAVRSYSSSFPGFLFVSSPDLLGATGPPYSPSANIETTVKLGPCIFYGELLSAEDVAALYTALMVPEQSPLISGYSKAVFELAPFVYTKLDDYEDIVADNENYEAKTLVPFRPLTIISTASNFRVGDGLQFRQPGPFQGSQSIAFSGTGLLEYFAVGGGHGARYGYSVSFWIKLNAAPTASRYIISNGHTRNNLLSGVSVSINSSSQLFITTHLSNNSTSANTFTAYTVPLNTWTFVTITLDRAEGKGKLFIDGTLNSEINISATDHFWSVENEHTYISSTTDATSYPSASSTVNVGRLYIGGYSNYARTSVSGVSANLSEVALFARPLSADEIAYLYSARLTE